MAARPVSLRLSHRVWGFLIALAGAVLLAYGPGQVLVAPAAAQGKPAGILISDTGGLLRFLDLRTGAVSVFHTFADGGNFDIQYVSPNEIVLANHQNARIDRFDLESKSLTNVVGGPPLSNPIGIAVSSDKQTYYIADPGAGSIFSYDVGAGTVALLANQGPQGEGLSPDGITVDDGGRVVFSNHDGRIYRVDPADLSIELVTSIPGAALNGLVFDRQGNLIVAAHDAAGPGFPGAVYRVNPATGVVTTLWHGLPFRDAEDVALDARGNVYVADTDFQHAFVGFNPAIYVLKGGAGPPQALASAADGDQLGDIVDILLRPACTEDGLQSVPLGGLASGTVHNGVEPPVNAINGGLGGLVHQVNCEIVVPVEDGVDRLLSP